MSTSGVCGSRTGRGSSELRLAKECSGTGNGMPRGTQVSEQMSNPRGTLVSEQMSNQLMSVY